MYVPSAMAQMVDVFTCFIVEYLFFILLFRLVSFHQRASSSADRCDVKFCTESFGMQIQYDLIYNIRTVIQRLVLICCVAAFPVFDLYVCGQEETKDRSKKYHHNN